MQAPSKTTVKTHYNPTNVQSVLLEKQKNALLVVLTDYIEKTTDKATTLANLGKLNSITTPIKPCSNC